MKVNKKYFFLLTVITAVFFACKKETEVLPINNTSRYYPNQEGRFVIYHIDSLYYNQFTSKIDTFSFDIKEKVLEFFYDASGRKSQRIQRYKKTNGQWALIRVWKAFVSNTRVEKTEEDITYIKLIFPLYQNLAWSGNAMNTLDTATTKQQYVCTNINSKFNNTVLNFDSCATIIQKSDSTLITKNEIKEVYAINVGLIYKRITNISDKTTSIDPSKPISKRANSGTDVIIVATSYGKE